MRKLLKYTALLLLFLVCCASLLLFPSVQKFLANKVLSNYFDDVSISELRIGFYGANMKKFSIRYEDTTVRFDELQVAWSPKDLLFSRKLNIKNATISNASVSLESEVKDPIYYEKTIERPVFNQETLGLYIESAKQKLNEALACFRYPLSIDSLAMTGTFDVYEKTLGEFSIGLVDFAPSREARVQFALTSSFSRKFDGSFSLKGGLELHRASDGMIDNLHIDSSIISKNYANNTKKAFGLELGINPEKSRAYFNFTDSDTARRIIGVVAEKPSPSGSYVLNLDGYLDNSILEYFLFGNKMEAWSIALNGRGENVANVGNWMFKSNLDVNLSDKILTPVLPSLDSALNAHATFALIFRGQYLELTSLTMNVSDENHKQLVCACDLQSPCKIFYDSESFNGGVTKILKGLSLDFNVEHFDLGALNNICPDVSISGIGCGKVACQIQGDGVSVFSRDDDKLQLKDVDFGYMGQPVVKTFNLETKLSSRFDKDFEVEFSEISLNDVASNGVTLQGACRATVGKDKNHVSGYFVGDLPAILGQPMFKNPLKVTAGMTSLNFDFDINPDLSCSGESSAKLKSVSFAGDKNCLEGECDVKLSEPEGQKGIKFDVSGNVRYLGGTNLDLHGTFTTLPEDGAKNVKASLKNIQASLRGSKLCISDLLVLKDIFAVEHFNKNGRNFINDKEVLKQPAAEHNYSDELTLKLGLNIDEIYWKNFRCLSNLSCDLKYGSDGLSIPNLRCYIFDAPFNGNLDVIRSTNENKDSYAINTTFSLTNLNASKCVSALGYDPAVFTGQFIFEGSLESEGQSIEKAISNLRGSVRMNGHSGSLKFTPFLSSTQRNLLGVAGIATGALGGRSAALSELIDYFDNLQYETITASVVRGSDNNIVLDNFVVKNTDMKFLSRGKVFCKSGVEAKDYGLSVESQILTKGRLAELFGQLDLLSGEADYYGYAPGPRISVNGTVGNPDLSEIKSLIKKVGTSLIDVTDEKSMLNPKNLIKMFGN